MAAYGVKFGMFDGFSSPRAIFQRLYFRPLGIYSIAFPAQEAEVCRGNTMNPEEQVAGQDKPAPEKADVSGPPTNRPRQGPRRPPFRRGNRGPRGGGSSRPSGGLAKPVEPGAHDRPSASIHQAIEQVEQIRDELKKALDDIHEVLQTLDQVEREKNASEHEIEKLRDSLRMLHREPSYPRPQRPSPPRSSAPPPSAPPESDESDNNDDEGI